MEGINGCNQPKDDHDGRKAESEGAEGTMPVDAAGRDESRLNKVKNHPERECRSMDVKDGTWQWGPQHADTEIGRRKPDDDDHAEQDRHAAKEDVLGGAIDRPEDQAAG
jgi:hypothetical protein